MSTRFGAAMAVVAVVAAATAAYFAGLSAGQKGLTDDQRAEVGNLIAEKFDSAANDAITNAVTNYLVENPQVIADASIDQTRFGARVREFLTTNPEVINEAFAELEKKRAEQEVAQRAKAIEDNKETLFSSPRQIVLGNPDGDVTLVELFDYNCTYCRRAQKDMEKLLSTDPKLKVILKEFPVLGPGSVEAAQVGVALKLVKPEIYPAFHDKLLTSAGPVDKESALDAAAELGADRDAVEAALKDSEVGATIEESYKLANALSLTGTPSYVVQNQVVIGAVGYDQLSSQINSIRTCGNITC